MDGYIGCVQFVKRNGGAPYPVSVPLVGPAPAPLPAAAPMAAPAPPPLPAVAPMAAPAPAPYAAPAPIPSLSSGPQIIRAPVIIASPAGVGTAGVSGGVAEGVTYGGGLGPAPLPPFVPSKTSYTGGFAPPRLPLCSEVDMSQQGTVVGVDCENLGPSMVGTLPLNEGSFRFLVAIITNKY
ncbi:hypothetical protein NECAME_00522 [Necator americanus]|uniref:Uncharacterized protein n=1 Tax=Necator americanus TaxID=51031 RepID=W2T750_NECAM|nr:hypothetical protein NECAME_00522 [Necator americanus]ETN76996.1 hypothetical protein NECAME_00522 [Necator americanus]